MGYLVMVVAWLSVAAATVLPAETTTALTELGCTLCHEVPQVATPPRDESCQGCHVWVREVSQDPARRARALAAFPLWSRYEAHVEPYQQVPSLAAAMARLEPAWVLEYLRDPYDLRPHLDETMPRLHLSLEEERALLAGFAASRAKVATTAAPSPQNVARGEAIFDQRGCASCHTFGGRATETGLGMAPDLAHARDRLDPDMAVAWIVDPQAVSPHATMPKLGLSPDEAIAVRDFLWLAEPAAVASVRVPTGVPAPVSHAVSWAEVEERVFGRVCVHCHMEPSLSDGRGGPGYDGGFGWPARGIELQTREGVMANADAALAAMLRRRHEVARDHVGPGEAPRMVEIEDHPGMPLGLPAIADEDIALVMAWIAQGMPE